MSDVLHPEYVDGFYAGAAEVFDALDRETHTARAGTGEYIVAEQLIRSVADDHPQAELNPIPAAVRRMCSALAIGRQRLMNRDVVGDRERAQRAAASDAANRASTCEDGDTGFVPLGRATVSSKAATDVLLLAADRSWGTPVCVACTKPPTLYAFCDHPENDEKSILLDHEDPRVEYRMWVFDQLVYLADCEHGQPATDEKAGRSDG